MGPAYDGSLPYIAPDESYLLFTAERPEGHGGLDLFVGFHDRQGAWTQPRNLGPSINSAEHDAYPSVTPDGKYLFFLSRRDAEFDVYWVDAGILQTVRTAEREARAGRTAERLFGMVRAADGSPLPGATVTIHAVPLVGEARGTAPMFATATTDERGRFRRRVRGGRGYAVWAHGPQAKDGSYGATPVREGVVAGRPTILQITARHHRPMLTVEGGQAWAPRRVSRVELRIPALGMHWFQDDRRAPVLPAATLVRVLPYDDAGRLIAPVEFDPTATSGDVRLPRPVKHLFRIRLTGGLHGSGWLAAEVDGSLETLARIEDGDHVVLLPDDERLIRRHRVLFDRYAAGWLRRVDAPDRQNELVREVVADGGAVWDGILTAGSTLRGRLLLGGEPMGFTELWAHAESITYRDEDAYTLGHTRYWSRTDADGRFEFPWLRPSSGARVIAVLQNDHVNRFPAAWRTHPPLTAVVCFDKGGIPEIDLGDIEITRSHWLADVQIVGADGVPRLDAEAWITAGSMRANTERLLPVPVDQRGRFRSLVPRGAITLVARSGDAWAVQGFRVEGALQAGTVFPLRLALDPARSVTFRLIDQDERPIAGFPCAFGPDFDTPFLPSREQPPALHAGTARLVPVKMDPEHAMFVLQALYGEARRTDEQGEIRVPVPFGKGALRVSLQTDGGDLTDEAFPFDEGPLVPIVLQVERERPKDSRDERR